MNKKELLLEIGTEEIPAAALDHAVADLKRLATEQLERSRIDFSNIEALGTPRRLMLTVKLAPTQADIVIEKRGPGKSVAFDKEGNPTRAALGFAKGHGVDISEVCILDTDKGEYIGVKKTEIGRDTQEVLAEILPKIILDIPFRKSMRWSDGTIRFVRPMHWLLALYDGKVIDFKVGKVKSSNLTCGHRFLSPSNFAVKDYKHYKTEMRKRYVTIDGEERKKKIVAEITKIEKVSGFRMIEDAELLDHVANLVEYPVTVQGTFDEKFLALPEKVLLNSMREHQKYFGMRTKKNGALANAFISVLNTKPNDVDVVIKGNERVLRARLSDAEFFYNEDKKKTLEEYNKQLSGVIFQNKLGTMREKVERIMANAKFIAETVNLGWRDENPNEAIKNAVRAAELCKADLVTSMVGEFAKLQGNMGRDYARLSGEPESVAEAIFEHYLPAGADSTLPKTNTGIAVSIADKIDTIVACFSIGLKPTGSADPFALRRQTLGIILMLDAWQFSEWEKSPLSLKALITEAYRNIKDKATRPEAETVSDVLEFFTIRYKNLLVKDKNIADTEEISYDVFDAVIALGLDNIRREKMKMHSLSRFKKRDDFADLAISFKRVGNIVKGVRGSLTVDTSLFDDASEKTLYAEFTSVKTKVADICEKDGRPVAGEAGEYENALVEMSKLKEPVDNFFNNVMVMADDEAVKNNRLALLQSIQKVFLNIADFSKLS